MRLLYLNMILLFGSYICHSQKEDYIWMTGTYGGFSNPGDTSDWDGINYYNFNSDPVLISKDINSTAIEFNWTCSIISDKEGKLRYASNGMIMTGYKDNIIENGDTINFNNYWKTRTYPRIDGKTGLYGERMSQGMLMLPYTMYDSTLWLMYDVKGENGAIFDVYCKGLFYGNIDNKKDSVILKDQKFLEGDTLNYSSINACRHGNGRDWWIVVSSRDHNKYYIILFDDRGLHLHDIFHTDKKYPLAVGQAHFSPDGSKYLLVENNSWNWKEGFINLFDFDRSRGVLSHHKQEKFIVQEGFLTGCAFSQDGSKFYVANTWEIYQYETNAENVFDTKKTVAISDRYESFYPPNYYVENGFTFLQLAPDGKIYGPGGNTQHMHRIEYPDEKGNDCEVKQHIIHTLSNNSSIPNFPNFRLGPLDGSSADTLGLDNHPVAKFRYEGDTVNHLNVRFTDLSYFRPETWHWDFDDGTTFEGRKPYWHEFPKNGTYNVCLTVSNENSENTMCRQVTIGSTSTLNLPPSTLNYVSLFPNPTEGEVLLTLSDYIPEHGEVYVYDMMGREVFKDRIFYGWNSIDISSLPTGQYLYEVKDNTSTSSVLVGEGKLVKL